MWLRTVLPERQLDAESRATVKLGIGLIATMTALVLGLVTASAKSSFDAVDTGVKQTATQILALDRVLARYGSETGEIRKGLQRTVGARIDTILAAGLSQACQSGSDELGNSVRSRATRGRNPGFEATQRLPAGAPVPCAGPFGSTVARQVASHHRHRIVSSYAVPCGPPVLAHDHIRELRLICSAERHGCDGPLRLCTVCWERRIPRIGDGWALRRLAQGLPGSVALRTCASESVADEESGGRQLSRNEQWLVIS